MKRFETRTIKNDEDLAWAVGQIDLFWASEEGTPEFEYLMVLSDLASEILRRKKALSIAQIRALHNEWHLPAEILIRETRLAVKR